MVKRDSGAARRFVALAGGGASVNEAIEKLVRDLLRNTTCPPTDLKRLYPLFNITAVKEEQNLSVAGQLRLRDRETTIVHASGMPETRVRFTIAHEMAHALIERSGRGRPRQGKDLERLCDRFAAELL